MLDIGRVCVKTMGREAGKLAIIVKKIDDTFVLIDGNVKRRKCNIAHLEPTEKNITLKEDSSTEVVHKSMEAAQLKVIKRKVKEKKVVKKAKP